MTDLLRQALAAPERLPPDRQDAIARVILLLVRSDAWTEIAPEHLPFVVQGLAEIARGEFAADEGVETAFRSFVQQCAAQPDPEKTISLGEFMILPKRNPPRHSGAAQRSPESRTAGGTG